MGKIYRNWLVVLLAVAAIINVTEGRAKAEADWDDEFDDFFSEDKSDEAKEEIFPRSNFDSPPAASAPMSAPAPPNTDIHANHPPAHYQAQSSPNEPKQNWAGTGGFQGGNYASHNESCSPTGKQCMNIANMICTTTDGAGRCACIGGWVYERNTEACWKIPMSSSEACAHDVQCQAGSWAHLSRCNKQTARCECHDWHGNREMVRSEDGVCYVKKTVGDLCNTHEECDRPIHGDAFCQYGDHESAGGSRYNGSCQCRNTHVWYFPSSKCLPKSTKLGDPCEVSHQCREGSLGKLSLCNIETAKCECWHFGGMQNKTEVIYDERLRKCFLKKEYNDTCTEDDECRANLGPDVECGTTDEYPDTEVCHCPKGKVCRSSGFSTVGGNAFSTLSLACAATVVGVTIRMKGFFSGNF